LSISSGGKSNLDGDEITEEELFIEQRDTVPTSSRYPSSYRPEAPLLDEVEPDGDSQHNRGEQEEPSYSNIIVEDDDEEAKM
jgi:hypothetical protein